MDLRPALLDASDVALTTGIIAGQVMLAADPAAAPPEWIKVTPRGRVTARDGRSFDFDPAVLAARFRSDAIDIPVDTDHSTVLLGGQGRKPRTIGYASAIEARDDGTYAKVDWNALGRTTLGAKTHRFVSPTIHHDGNGRVTWLHSVALVSAPALTMPAVLHATQGNPMKEIARALGLAEDATEAACLAALGRRTELKPLAAALGLPDTADAAALLSTVSGLRTGGNGLVTELQGTVATLGARVLTAEKTLRDRDVADLLDGALRDKKIVPAQRAAYVAMCATDDGMKGVRELITATPAMLGASGLDGLPAPTGGDATVDPVTLAAEAQKLVTAGTFNNIADAVMSLHHKKG